MEFLAKEELCADGPQRKYKIAASKLLATDIYIPEVQRDIRKEHVDEIYKFQVDHYDRHGRYCFLGVLTFGVYGGKYYCIDGQHRYMAIRQLYMTFKARGDFYVDIEELECASEADLVEYFRIINLNSPVPDFLRDFKPQVAVVLRDHIKRVYGAYLSAAATPRKPNIGLESFLSRLQIQYGAEVCALRTEEEIVGWFERTNAEHGVWLARMAEEEPDVKKALEAVQGGKRAGSAAPKFFLGCYWLDDLSRSFSQPKRKKVWDTYLRTAAKDEDGCIVCPCCEETLLNPFEFEVGHKISHKNGGSNTCDNLIPICSLCNKSMGAMNFDDYRAAAGLA